MQFGKENIGTVTKNSSVTKTITLPITSQNYKVFICNNTLTSGTGWAAFTYTIQDSDKTSTQFILNVYGLYYALSNCSCSFYTIGY